MKKKIKIIHVIINPAAGKDESILPVIHASMKEAGIQWEASVTQGAGDAIRFARAAVKKGIDALAVYGGDGTIMEAVGGLVGSEVPLVILPGGSGNVLATELGIPKDLKEACAFLGHGGFESKAIDLGRFNKRYFVVGVSLGFEADVIQGADRESKKRIGIFAYFISALAAAKKIKKAVYHLVIDGQKHEVEGVACIIANTGNLGFSSISFDRHIDVSDGFLDVVVVRKANLGLFKLMAITLIKRERPENLELVQHWQGKDIHVSSSPAQKVQCDGELLETMPLHVTVVPGAIQVLVPEKAG